MKKILSIIAVLMLSASININATTINNVDNGSKSLAAPSCFQAARQIVIAIYGEINLGNVHHVLALTELCEQNQQ
jgi:hypothetical protein